MASTTSLLCIALLVCVVLLPFKRAEAAATCGHFEDNNCLFHKMSTATQGLFTSTCKRDDNSYNYHASINLDDYLANIDGRIVAGQGFASSCYGFNAMQDLNGNVWVFATCQKRDKSYVDFAHYMISDHVTNVDGDLEWLPCSPD